ncbi:hypothetical protein C8J57DRAFT_1660890 [Mycena rebaudengoi]|nr:hypothetical protein C8J57DRAFT_1660890 [Mycena rebaudengoi]
MPVSLLEVPYEKADLSGILKKELIAMVERQVDKWPYLTGFDPKAKATTASRLRAALLDPKNGFTRAVSVTLPSSPDTSLDRDNIRDGGLGTSPTPEQDDDSDTCWVKLLLEDSRDSSRHPKYAQDILLCVVDRVGCAPGEWRADLGDLLAELQTSNSAITGPVKLSYRDPENAEYRVCFVKVTDDALLEESQPFPALITIPATKYPSLEIFIEQAEDVYFHAEPRIGLHHRTSPPEAPGQFHVQDGNAKPLEIARQRQRAAPDNHVETNGDIEWLAEQIKTIEGYADFQDKSKGPLPISC